MRFTKAIALIATITASTAPAAADFVTIDFESLGQTDIYSGTGWAGLNTRDLLDDFAAEGITMSSGMSGVNIDNIFLPNGNGSNAITNSIRSSGVDTLTPNFSMSAVGGVWSEFSFNYLLASNVNYTAYDADGNVIVSGVLSATPLVWTEHEVNLGGELAARIDFSGSGADIFLDDVGYTLIPSPGAAGLAITGLCLCGLRRNRRSGR